MVVAISILLVTAVVVVIDLPSLLKKQQKKERWAYGILLVPTVVVSMLLGFGVDVPNPLDLIQWLFKPIVSFLYQLLH